MRIVAITAASCLLLLGACKREKQPPTVRLQKGESTPPRKQAVPVPLPQAEKQTPLPAERIVDLFYTANVGGDADPCG